MKPSTGKADGSHASNGGKAGKLSVSPPTLIFAGFARLPAGAGVLHGEGVLALELEVDPYDMRIVDAACDCLGALGRKFLVELLVGRKVEDGLAGAIAGVRSRYLAAAQVSMVAALEDVLRRCKEHGILERHPRMDPDRTSRG